MSESAVLERKTINATIASLMRAEAPSRDLDALIAGAINMPMPNDPAGWPPRYTSSLDAAHSLVPEGWYWRVGSPTLYKAWAGCYKMHPDHTIEGETEFNWHRDHWEPQQTTPAMALCIVALEARRALIRPRP